MYYSRYNIIIVLQTFCGLGTYETFILLLRLLKQGQDKSRI